MFGPKFQAWQDKNANLVDGLGALGVGLSQWDAGQPVDMIGAWDSIQNRRAQRKFGEAMRDPALLAGFTPEQKSMLAQMPAQMAQQLIMEKVFAPPPDPVKPNYDYIDGFGMVDMNNPPADMMAGNFKPAPGPAPMSQADRDFWGIPKDDPRAWVIGKDGKPEAIGDLPKPADMPSSVDEYNFYKAQEEAAGRQALSYNEWDLQSKKAGATTVTVGTPGEAPPAGDALRASMNDADTMLTMIQNIGGNKALPKVTGAFEGGGGNNVDEMNLLQRGWYGDDGLALIQEIGQLQGNAWLGARALLKGGGAITDYESKKAEGAMARLSRAQGTEEFKAALKDLQDALTAGVEKLKAAQGGTDPASIPDGISPQEWEAMTPEEKALFQ